VNMVFQSYALFPHMSVHENVAFGLKRKNVARAEIARRTEALFRQSGALRDGHFLLKSGRHSDAYLEKFAVLSDPAATSELCGFWAGRHRGADDRPTVDLVAGPTTGGVILAFETGRQLGTRAIFAEEVKAADGPARREFRRGFRIEPGERVLLVDDILTTGGSLLAMIPAVEAAGGEILRRRSSDSLPRSWNWVRDCVQVRKSTKLPLNTINYFLIDSRGK